MINLIIVEDNIHFSDALTEIVAQISNVQLQKIFADAETAIAEMPVFAPAIVLVDIQLKGKLSGIDLIKQTKVLLKNTEFLICSAHDDSLFVFDALKSGAAGYILKDASMEEIKMAIVEVTQGGAPMSPYIARQVIHSFRQTNPSLNNTELLTPREKEVLLLLSKGMLYKEIGDHLAITHSTVKKHIRNIYEKLHVQNKVEALNKYGLL